MCKGRGRQPRGNAKRSKGGSPSGARPQRRRNTRTSNTHHRKSRRQVNRENQEQGREGEERTRSRYELMGYNVTRTGKGHDFKATKTNPLTGKKETVYVETKTGGAKLSPLQKKKRRQFGGRYVVENGDSVFDANPHSSNEGGFFGMSVNRSPPSHSAKSRKTHTTKKTLGNRIRKSITNTLFSSNSGESRKRSSSSKGDKDASISRALWGDSKQSRKRSSSSKGDKDASISRALWGDSKQSRKRSSDRRDPSSLW